MSLLNRESPLPRTEIVTTHNAVAFVRIPTAPDGAIDSDREYMLTVMPVSRNEIGCSVSKFSKTEDRTIEVEGRLATCLSIGFQSIHDKGHRHSMRIQEMRIRKGHFANILDSRLEGSRQYVIQTEWNRDTSNNPHYTASKVTREIVLGRMQEKKQTILSVSGPVAEALTCAEIAYRLLRFGNLDTIPKK